MQSFGTRNAGNKKKIPSSLVFWNPKILTKVDTSGLTQCWELWEGLRFQSDCGEEANLVIHVMFVAQYIAGARNVKLHAVG